MKAYTDLEQSKKLAEFLSIESADMIYPSDFDFPFVWIEKPKKDKNAIPCWSLSALLDVLPKYIGDYSKCLYYDVGGYYCRYMDDGDFMLTIEETNADNPIDACVEMILKLHEEDLL